MKKTKWREQIDQLEVGESVEIESTMKDKSLRAYIYGMIPLQTGKKFSVNKIQDNQYNITRKV